MNTNTGLTLVRGARVLTYLVYAFVLFSLVILLLGFFLLLFGANPDAPFAEWAYRSLDRVMAPFRGLFESIDLSGNSVFDPSVIFAMIVYGIVGLALSALIDWLTEKMMLLRSRQAYQVQQQQVAAQQLAAQQDAERQTTAV
ncbi:YggT family protein [Solirubrobacter soli]|uniref:YggT family protein n=1 Tax=Solirubrobacter soli TaxID=363832 RepID=UPI0003F96281|nr:YggT family protein [Solirubrobacter soli]